MKVLIVDDSKAMRMIVRRSLTQAGFTNLQAIEANNGVEALQVIYEQSPDLILSDWNMPEMNGLDFVKSIRAEPRFGSIPILMVTTETEADQMCAALEAGANEYVIKPFTDETIEDKLRMLGVIG